MTDYCKWCGMERKALSHWKCGTRLTARGSLIQSDACAELSEYKRVVRQVVEINIQRDDTVEELSSGDAAYWCHECKSWNHRMDFDDRCTTKMLQKLIDKEPT